MALADFLKTTDPQNVCSGTKRMCHSTNVFFEGKIGHDAGVRESAHDPKRTFSVSPTALRYVFVLLN